MIVEFNLMNILYLISGLLAGFWALAKIISRQNNQIVNARFDVYEKLDAANNLELKRRLEAIETAAKAEANQWQRIEREMLTLKAEIPIHYVRREDYIRGQSVLEAKLDGLGMKMENAQLRAAKSA